MNAQKKNKSEINVIGVCGSLRERGFTRMALQIALEGSRELGARIRLIDLRDYQLPFCDGRDRDEYPNDVKNLRKEIGDAQGLILGTPEYHGGMSGALKNALDLMGFDEIEGKMIGLIGVSGGNMGAANALTSLRAIGRSLHAWLLPHQASVPQARKVFDASGKIKDPELEERVKEVGRQVARFAYLHSSEKTREFVQAWEEAPLNPGGQARGFSIST